MLLSRLVLFWVLGLYFCCAHAFSFADFTAGFNSFFNPSSSPSTPTPTPTPTSTSTPTSVDSGKVRPPGGMNSSTSVSPVYSGVVIPSAAVYNEQYATANLSPCPASPVCPDINGKTRNNAPANCPDFCTVDRVVTESTVGTVVRITSTTAAACPLGYIVVGTYKVGKEIIVNPNPAPAPAPIGTMQLYNDYVASGYSCELYGAENLTMQCGGSGWNTSSFSSTLTNPKPVGIYSYIGQYTRGGPDTSTNYCWDAYSSCNLYCSGPASITKYNYYYKYVRCTPPPNSLYYSGNMVPTSLVCAVRKDAWLKKN